MKEQPSYRFRESVAVSLWIQATMLMGIGAVAAGLIGPIVQGYRPWTWYALYYPIMLAVLAVMVIAMTAFRQLKIAVTDDSVDLGFGFLSRSLPLQAIQACEVRGHSRLLHGGWGLGLSSAGRRDYSMPGVSCGVEISVEQDRKARRYFVSSHQPERLAEAMLR